MTKTDQEARVAPENESEFQELMELVDRTLQNQGVPLHSREMAALSEVSRLLKVMQWPMQARDHQPLAGSYSGLDLTARLIRWVRDRYGERLKAFDPRPGRVALLLRSDVWVFHLPLIVGGHDVVASREIESSKGIEPPNRPTVPVYNILDALEGLTPSLKRTLTDQELSELLAIFRTGMAAYLLARSLHDRPFVTEAITDHESTVGFLAGNDRHAGQARWAALQASEKMLKSCIELSGGRPGKHHDLRRIASAVTTASGLVIDPAILDRIQVTADVRYGQISATVQEAVKAHHASLEITRAVAAHMRRQLGRDGLDWSSVRPSY